MTFAPSPALPLPLTPLVGRDYETLELRDLVLNPAVRLITLTGPGGVGKTRLALHIAQAVREAFPDGVWYVQLESIRAVDLVLPTIAQAVGVPDSSDGDIMAQLVDRLGTGRCLFVLDNFEQVVDAGHIVGELLTALPGSKALVTSRTPIEVYGEREFPLNPLHLPHSSDAGAIGDLGHYPAIRLFVDRATAVKPSFALTTENAADVLAICRRLDGLPLAIELAAARTKVLSPAALLSRLENRLRVLTSGPRSLPARQQTMRDAISWSYDLLQPDEQRLFRVLSVFSGGFTLEAVEYVVRQLEESGGSGDLDSLAALDQVEILVDQSLVRRIDDAGSDEPRFAMFQTIAEFAAGELEQQGEAEHARTAHAAIAIDLVERAAPQVVGPKQVVWLEMLEREHDNIRAALEWVLDRGDVETAERIAKSVWRFWWIRGHLSEGRRWLERVLALPADDISLTRAHCLRGAASLAEDQGDMDYAISLYERALVAAREHGDDVLTALVLDSFASIEHGRGGYDESLRLHLEAKALYEKAGDRRGLASCLHDLGTVYFFGGDLDLAEKTYEQAIELFRSVGDIRATGTALGNLGIVEITRGKIERAIELQEECLRATQAVGDEVASASALINLADAWRQLGDLPRATAINQQALEIANRFGIKRLTALIKANLGQIASIEGDSERAIGLLVEAIQGAWESQDLPSLPEIFAIAAPEAAAQGRADLGTLLLGAGTTMRASLGHEMAPDEEATHHEIVTILRSALGEEVFERVLAEGETTPLEAVIEQVRNATALIELTPERQAEQALAERTGLKLRELAALRLFIADHSNAEIAERLDISLAMATALIGQLYTRVGASTRADLTAFAFKHGVV